MELKFDFIAVWNIMTIYYVRYEGYNNVVHAPERVKVAER